MLVRSNFLTVYPGLRDIVAFLDSWPLSPIQPVLEAHLLSLNKTEAFVNEATLLGGVQNEPGETLGACPGDDFLKQQFRRAAVARRTAKSCGIERMVPSLRGRARCAGAARDVS